MQDMPATEDKWFYEEKGQRLGGIDEPAIISLIQSGKLGYGSSVWKTGFANWMKLEDTSLRSHLNSLAPPPLSGQHISNTLVWILAFAPLLGFLLECFVAGMFYGNQNRALNAVGDGKFLYIPIALNILLCVFDEKRLKQAGHNTDKFKGWVWLVPVYLYQRAKQLQQSLAYFAVWIACFVVLLLV